MLPPREAAELPKAIRAIRKEFGLSYSVLSSMSYISRTTIRKAEGLDGRRASVPSEATYEALKRVFNFIREGRVVKPRTDVLSNIRLIPPSRMVDGEAVPVETIWQHVEPYSK